MPRGWTVPSLEMRRISCFCGYHCYLSHVLHWPTPQGKVPQGDDNSWARLLWTRVSRIFLLCRKETKGLLQKIVDVSGLFFKM